MAWPTDLIGELSMTPDRVATITRGVLNDELDRAAGDEWSSRTILAHLRELEFMVMRIGLERMISEADAV